ncbi:hypothetical protein [Sorangium sp. So ce1182]|uniref:hypothetical protein n=1 Tax=Sorangium sp. So ce1182 TaxID=3133334 RepID=UPI003F607642
MSARARSWTARARPWLAAALAAYGAAVAVPTGCSGTTGQLMFVFRTDMSLPKDIDAIRVLVTLAGAVVYDETYTRLGSEEGIRLPATLGFYTPDDPTEALHLRLIATQGGDDNVRLLNQVVTTVPEDRTAVLDVPVQLLCYGRDEVERDEGGRIKRDPLGAPQSRCGEAGRCKAGTCETREVRALDLPDYVEARVFGGGSGRGDGKCFHTTQCFERAKRVPIKLDLNAYDPQDEDSCWAVADETASDIEDFRKALEDGAVNLALLTQGGGICSQSECYAPLDADSDAGWSAFGGRIRLPSAVCGTTISGDLRGVVAVPSEFDGQSGGTTCARKDSSLPTCGSWSSSGQGEFTPDQDAPTPLALGLAHPTALAVTETAVYWTETGTFSDADDNSQPDGNGAVKWVPRGGGNPLVLARDLWAPRHIAVREPAENEAGESELVFWTMPGEGVADGEIRIATPELGEPGGVALLAGRGRPQGLALLGNTLYWTEESSGNVFQADISEVTTTDTWLSLQEGEAVLQEGEAVSLTGPGPDAGLAFESPYRVAAAAEVVCWVYQGQLEPRTDGAVVCQQQGGEARVIAPSQTLPRALVLDGDSVLGGLQLYWATYQAEGEIFRVDLRDLDSPAPVDFVPVPIAAGQPFPGGLAVDGEYLYWTNQLEGTVMRAPKPRTPDETVQATPLVRNQRRPGAIALQDDVLYWVNEGSPGPQERDGAILRLQLAR